MGKRFAIVIGVAAAGVMAFGALALTATPAAGATLWNQFDNASLGVTNSQDYEPSFATSDDLAADDFVVPDGEKWKVKQVEVDGAYFNGPGPASSVTVRFFRNHGGLPFVDKYFLGQLDPSSGLDTGDFVIPMPLAVKLHAGQKFWVSVQANLDFNPGGQWGWADRTVQSGQPAAWRNTGDGFGTGCTSFAPRGATCGMNPSEPDQVFKLRGKAVPLVP